MEGFENLTLEEADRVYKGEDDPETSKRIKFIRLAPSALFIDKVDKYYVLKDDRYIEKIRKLSGRTSKYAITFIDYLIFQSRFTQQRDRTGWAINLELETIALHLNMEGYIKKRQWDRIQKEITKYLEIAKELGYVLSYEGIENNPRSIVTFKLDKDKFNAKEDTPEEEIDFDSPEMLQ